MASVARSEKILAQLSNRTGISDCGRTWLTEALDPFHDNMISPVGYPDTTASASVVQVVKQSYQIASPLTASPTANWDCQVVMMPWVNSVNMNSVTASVSGGNYLYQSSLAATSTAGGIQVLTAASGTNLSIGQLTTQAGVSLNQSNTVPAQYLQGNQRIVAMAMEITNTTSDLNRQGLVTLYRIPVPQNDDGTTFTIRQNLTTDTSSYLGSADGVFIPFPPINIAAAQLFAGTKAWNAELGTYQVAAFNTPDVPAQGLSYTMPILYNVSATDPQVVAPLFTQSGADAHPSSVGVAMAPPVCWTEFDMSGAYFTGLSGATTLTVNYIMYIERFPTQDDLDLIVSAKRSPEYDIKALEAYSIIAQSLPVGVPFAENGLGDWFKSAVNTASEYLSPVLKMVPHPYAQLAANAISTAKYVTDSFDQPPTEQSIPNAPMGSGSSMALTSYAPRRGNGGVQASTLKNTRKKLKKVTTREAKFENRVRNELAGTGTIVRGKRAPRAPRRG
jgi:hypothetical protein